ncbi:tRNA (guanosine(46)-N7)-methyltransferase TrmB [Pseudohalioglobus lutimaris]|uniref:tRNA (guanine-N(7)-)-methyltransferase n=1 Tax=Pseudohalioglobus lutimaris TaxID=1737061 RepID=A0A2N5X904_9GAMM|nr:tRNA (guanosine(46)-N7)-methyltransferase TrmB [Pseudohalioglobus lutimaris]PLW70965.1 tRNA (guanosine(46)-N7)-methyltransferase TrmB [Pseudohalioglobus lutimaris]
MKDSEQDRRIRSYVLRKGRMTPGQQRAFNENWAQWGLEHADGTLDFDRVFGRPGPRVLEIGFGMGQSLVAMASAAPETNFVGIEVHRPGVGRLLHSMADEGVGNIRIYCHDAVEVLRDCIADDSLDTVQVFFPDPWHKKRHHKRRLIQPEFVDRLRCKLKPGGILHLATDWENYAEQMMEVLSEADGYANTIASGEFAPRPESRPLTKFEARGERLGHGVWDLLFTRTD